MTVSGLSQPQEMSSSPWCTSPRGTEGRSRRPPGPWQGVTREHTANVRPKNDAGRTDAAVATRPIRSAATATVIASPPRASEGVAPVVDGGDRSRKALSAFATLRRIRRSSPTESASGGGQIDQLRPETRTA